MLTIHKYRMSVERDVYLNIPANGVILHVDLQDGKPTLWAEVDDDEPLTMRIVHIVGTGHPVPERAKYICTYQQPPYVWHVYESE